MVVDQGVDSANSGWASFDNESSCEGEEEEEAESFESYMATFDAESINRKDSVTSEGTDTNTWTVNE